MRVALGCLLLLSSLGCKGVSPGQSKDCLDGAGSASCLAHADEHCPLHAAGHKCAICDKKKEKDRDVKPRSGPDEGQPREAVVTQDIMLIPRMVYVPYAPQVPVNPARLGTVVPGARGIELPPAAPRDTNPNPRDITPAPRDTDKQICDTLDRCTHMMQIMDKRICDLEKCAKNPPAAQPIIIQQAPAGPHSLIPSFFKSHLPCLGGTCAP